MNVSLVRPKEPTSQEAPKKIEKQSYGVKLWNAKILKTKALKGTKLNKVATAAKNTVKIMGRILSILPSLLATIFKSAVALGFNGIIRPLKNRSIKKQIAKVEAKNAEAKAKHGIEMKAFTTAKAVAEAAAEKVEAPAEEVVVKQPSFKDKAKAKAKDALDYIKAHPRATAATVIGLFGAAATTMAVKHLSGSDGGIKQLFIDHPTNHSIRCNFNEGFMCLPEDVRAAFLRV
jgi:hypothetical protein